jgi:protein-S-isoprenylcysteine O-methyltransferase Ste14
VSGVHYWFAKPYADFVAKLRVPCGFLLLVTFALLATPSLASISIGLPIAALGLTLRGWAAGHLAKNQNLATSGPYSYTRNPLYLGTLIVAGGIVVACRNWVLAGTFAAVFGLIYLPVIELEEQHLRNIFPNYFEYAGQVPRLLPLRRWTKNRTHFSWALYFKNEEYKAFLGFLIAVGWLVLRLGRA